MSGTIKGASFRFFFKQWSIPRYHLSSSITACTRPHRDVTSLFMNSTCNSTPPQTKSPFMTPHSQLDVLSCIFFSLIQQTWWGVRARCLHLVSICNETNQGLLLIRGLTAHCCILTQKISPYAPFRYILVVHIVCSVLISTLAFQ